MSASSNHLGHHFAYGFKVWLLGDFPVLWILVTHPPSDPSLFQKYALGIQSRWGQSLMMSLSLVKQNDCTLWNHQLEAFPNRDTKAEGTTWDLSLYSSQSLALYLWTRRIPLLLNTWEPGASHASSYRILGLLWPFLPLLLPSFFQCIYSTNMLWEPTLCRSRGTV